MELAWTKFNEGQFSDRDTGDPLGFRACSHEIARVLIPGITQRTSKVRGFSLLALGLDRVDKQPREWINEYFFRFERLMIASQIWHEKGSIRDVYFSGKQKAQKHLRGSEKYPLNEPILGDQQAGGIWGTYRKASAWFGFVESWGGRSTSPAFTGLTPDGRKLARIALPEILSPNFKIISYLDKDDIDHSIFKQVYPQAHIASEEEVNCLSKIFKKIDGGQDGELHALWEIFKRDPRNFVFERLEPKTPLTGKQQAALRAGQALEALIEAIEVPWRFWVTGDFEKPPEIPLTIGSAPEWDIIKEWGRSALDLMDLRHTLQRPFAKVEDVFNAIQEFHVKLCELRGNEPWERWQKIKSRPSGPDYDYCLGAAASLFAEGVQP